MRLFEAGSALLFFGALAQQPALHDTATKALTELSSQGYQLPDADNPVRVFPALTSGAFSARHAGGWRPGVIYLRQGPQGSLSEDVYLRHELFHEASHKTCGGRLPAWAEEALAMRFSGELAGLEAGPRPNATELEALRQRIQQGAELAQDDLALLGRLLANSKWSDQPCNIPDELRTLFGSAFDAQGSESHILISLQSGRLLESGGDIHARMPPGSLLKLIYAAALESANPEILSAELAASDTDRLLQRRRQFQAARYRLLLSPIEEQPLAASLEPEEADWQAYLGGRDRNGNFPLQTNLPELALAMRAALLSKPDYFEGLTANGSLPGSTLAGQAETDKNLLRQMRILAKTGTVSTPSGQPLAGHLLLAWPAEHPAFLAIFRRTGHSGAAVLPKAALLLRKWRLIHPPEFATARVGVLTATSRASWEARADCPEILSNQFHFSLCGALRIVSTAKGSRSERLVHGILYASEKHGPAVLETDIVSYVDAVMSAEAQHLKGAAKEAMRAVIAWNAAHGRHRHADSSSLCDTTHCMVFMGETPDDQSKRGAAIAGDLLNYLDDLANRNNWHWLPFAAGGDERWQRQIGADALSRLFDETEILAVRRERRKNGELFVHLYYPQSDEVVACEIFRNTLKLPSCPDKIQHAETPALWTFEGLGAGHGLGLSVARAQAMANGGFSAEQILRDAYIQPIPDP
ncbi:MAG: hypothetical protein PHH11_09730 [Methylomonas sp.]|nr:hypothetical protein [Methylomonas sp.]